jgi:hypothetical protein
MSRVFCTSVTSIGYPVPSFNCTISPTLKVDEYRRESRNLPIDTINRSIIEDTFFENG